MPRQDRPNRYTKAGAARALGISRQRLYQILGADPALRGLRDRPWLSDADLRRLHRRQRGHAGRPPRPHRSDR